MNQTDYLQKCIAGVLFSIFFMLVCPEIHAQHKSASDTITHVIKVNKDRTKQCDELYKLGNYYWNIGDLANAQLVMNKSKELSEKYGYEKGIYDAYSILGAISLRQNDAAKALSIAQECLKLANKNHNEYGANRANYLLAVMAYQQGNIDSVISLSRRVLDAPHVVYDSVTLPKFQSMLANAYLAVGDLHNANTYFLQALDMAEKTNNQQLLTVCIANLALINFELKNFREALKYHRKALDMALKNNQIREEASVYSSMGSVYKNLELQDSALYFYKKALPLYKKLESKTDVAVVNTNLGGLLVYLGQPDSGMHYLLSAKRDFYLLKDTIQMAYNALAIGDAYGRMYHSKKDRSYLNKALTELLICKKFAELKAVEDLKMDCYFQLAIIYDAMGNGALAFDYLKRYNLISNAIRSKEYTGQIAEMQTKYETEKKELEISKLNASKLLDAEKIAGQKTMNYSLMAIAALLLVSGFLTYRNVQHKRVAEKQVALLEKQNAIENMRTKIATDVHDEMGANLTRLGLNAQQLIQSPAVPDKEKLLAERIALQSKEIITGMREIIWASNPANDNLKSMLGFMRQYVDRFFDGTEIRAVVNFPHDVGEVTLHPEVRRNLFFILKESLNNAMKYSGSDRVEIGFLNQNENFNLNIKDYGKGIDDSNKDEFSNGLRNMQMRAELIQSLFRLITAPGQGVQISIEGKLY